MDGSDGCHGVTAEWNTIEISGVQNRDLAGGSAARSNNSRPTAARSRSTRSSTSWSRDRLGTGILQHVGDEENVRAIMVHRTHTAGSDGMLVGGKPHPRAWGTFPRYLGHYCRELGLMSLEETVHHLTGRPAARLQLQRRGLVRAGYAADLVLFDPGTIAEGATFEEPRRPAVGISHVFVNGVAAIADGAPTGARAGRALRRTPHGTAPSGD